MLSSRRPIPMSLTRELFASILMHAKSRPPRNILESNRRLAMCQYYSESGFATTEGHIVRTRQADVAFARSQVLAAALLAAARLMNRSMRPLAGAIRAYGHRRSARAC